MTKHKEKLWDWKSFSLSLRFIFCFFIRLIFLPSPKNFPHNFLLCSLFLAHSCSLVFVINPSEIVHLQISHCNFKLFNNCFRCSLICLIQPNDFHIDLFSSYHRNCNMFYIPRLLTPTDKVLHFDTSHGKIELPNWNFWIRLKIKRIFNEHLTQR